MVFNARSLGNKTFGICEFLKAEQCDVCFITEAWIKLKYESTIAEIKDMGYDILNFNLGKEVSVVVVYVLYSSLS